MTERRKQRSPKLKEKVILRLMRGATLVEMLCLMALILCLIIGVFFITAIIEGWHGWLLGIALGSLLFFIPLMASAVLQDLWGGWGLPKCRNGCCRGPGYFRGHGDYDCLKSEEEYYYVCKCGDRYQRRGKRFVLINEDGTETPCLIWRRCRGWFPDKGQ